MALFQRSTDAEGEQDTKNTPLSMGDPVAALAAGSVLFSWYQFYVRGDAERGVFVGLWAPTLLSFANYVEHKDLAERFTGDSD